MEKVCTEDYSGFANPYEPCVTDINWLFSYTKENALGMVDTNHEMFTFSMFSRQLVSVLNKYMMMARSTANKPAFFIRTIDMIVMPESQLEDGELGRCNVYPLPKNLLSIVRLEYSEDHHNYTPMKQVHHNEVNKHQCCAHDMSEAWEKPCNECDPCNVCKNTYIRENDCIVLPFDICQSGQIRLTYKMGAQLFFKLDRDGNPETNFDIHPFMFDLIAYAIAQNFTRGEDAYINGKLESLEIDFIEHLKLLDEEEEDCKL